jgi:DNA-binding transcriptional LysR family regulator
MTRERLPDVDALALLVSVGELGSVGKAARLWGIALPSASARLATLERHVGFPLLHRSPAGSRLTEEGRLVVEWSRGVLTAAQTLTQGVDSLRQRRHTTFALAASMTIAEYLVPAWLSRMAVAHPGVAVGVRVANSAAVADAVIAGDVELGFVEGPSVPPGLHARVIARDRLVVVVVPSHPWARRRRPVSLQELAATPLIVREVGSGTRETLERFLEAFGEHSAPRLELGSTAAVKVALNSGAGPAVLSELAVAAEVAEGRLKVVSVAGLDLGRHLRAVWPEGRRLLGAPAAFFSIALAQGATTAAG